jgi:hypothetical protein
MDRSRALAITLGILLAVSTLLNVVAFQRMNAPARPSGPTAAAPVPDRAVPAPLPPDRTDQVLRELAALRREVAELKGSAPPAEAPAPGAPRPAPSAPSATIDDPQVAEVLSEQEHFRTFWKDLDRVFKARGKIDEAKYFETVLDMTLDYLTLPAPARARFSESARVAAAEFAGVRKEQDDARRALPPRDKDNAASVDAQRRAIDARFLEQSKAVIDRVRGQLDLQQPRHSEFSTRIDRWLRELGPK